MVTATVLYPYIDIFFFANGSKLAMNLYQTSKSLTKRK